MKNYVYVKDDGMIHVINLKTVEGKGKILWQELISQMRNK